MLGKAVVAGIKKAGAAIAPAAPKTGVGGLAIPKNGTGTGTIGIGRAPKGDAAAVSGAEPAAKGVVEPGKSLAKDEATANVIMKAGGKGYPTTATVAIRGTIL